MEQKIGKVVHYFPHVPAAVLSLEAPLKVGDTIHFKGHGADFIQVVESMEIEHQQVKSVDGGEVAVRAAQKVKDGTEVYLVQE